MQPQGRQQGHQRAHLDDDAPRDNRAPARAPQAVDSGGRRDHAREGPPRRETDERSRPRRHGGGPQPERRLALGRRPDAGRPSRGGLRRRRRLRPERGLELGLGLGLGRPVTARQRAPMPERHPNRAHQCGDHAGSEHARQEHFGRQPQALDDHQVGGVALRDGDRCGVGHHHDADEQRRKGHRRLAREDEQHRHHENHRAVQGDHPGQQRAQRAHQRVQNHAASARRDRQAVGGAGSQARALHQGGERERRAQEHEQRHDGRDGGRQPSAEGDVDSRHDQGHECRPRAAWPHDQRRDPDQCQNDMKRKQTY